MVLSNFHSVYTKNKHLCVDYIKLVLVHDQSKKEKLKLIINSEIN